jgi:ABC-type transporter Mla subunit MlaD
MGWLFSILYELQKLNKLLAALLPPIKEISVKMADLQTALGQLAADDAALIALAPQVVALLVQLNDRIGSLIAAGGDPAVILADVQKAVADTEAATKVLADGLAGNTPPAP